MGDHLTKIGELVRTQDNRITSHPMFVVEQEDVIYGVDPHWDHDGIVWLYRDDAGEVDTAKAARLEARYQLNGNRGIKGYIRAAYLKRWSFVTACFTEQGCKDYLAANGHNLRNPRIYAHSGWRNQEWQRMRAFLAAMPTTTTGLPEPAFRLMWDSLRAAYFVDEPNIGNTDVYTADQVRAALALPKPAEAIALADAARALAEAHGDIAFRVGSRLPVGEDQWLAADKKLTALRNCLDLLDQGSNSAESKISLA